MTNFKKVQGEALIIQGICEDIKKETEIIADDSNGICKKDISFNDTNDIIKSFKKIGQLLSELNKFYGFLSEELKEEDL